jgi:hypothetical protein
MAGVRKFRPALPAMKVMREPRRRRCPSAVMKGTRRQAAVLPPQALQEARGSLEATVGRPVAMVLAEQGLRDERGLRNAAEFVRLSDGGVKGHGPVCPLPRECGEEGSRRPLWIFTDVNGLS